MKATLAATLVIVFTLLATTAATAQTKNPVVPVQKAETNVPKVAKIIESVPMAQARTLEIRAGWRVDEPNALRIASGLAVILFDENGVTLGAGITNETGLAWLLHPGKKFKLVAYPVGTEPITYNFSGENDGALLVLDK